ncbi:phytanoyl-CoA dioxygenase family protein [Streptomyces sp. NPDC056656]|uniref:phytanoyl-CoA dioxygenase family protein n=1 Tax=Streptomyces sp. NPDC056656 TaxID=3345895 RepID=UPI00369CF7AE
MARWPGGWCGHSRAGSARHRRCESPGVGSFRGRSSPTGSDRTHRPRCHGGDAHRLGALPRGHRRPRAAHVHLPGSHRWSEQPGLSFFEQDLSTIDRYAAEHDLRIVQVPLERGQAGFHHCKTRHGSGSNRGTEQRRSIAIHLQPGDNHHVTAHNPEGLPAGHPLDRYVRPCRTAFLATPIPACSPACGRRLPFGDQATAPPATPADDFRSRGSPALPGDGERRYETRGLAALEKRNRGSAASRRRGAARALTRSHLRTQTPISAC